MAECPHCKAETTFTRVRDVESYNLSGINIDVVVDKNLCQSCNKDHIPSGSPDVMPLVYKEFKRKTGMDWKG